MNKAIFLTNYRVISLRIATHITACRYSTRALFIIHVGFFDAVRCQGLSTNHISGDFLKCDL